MHLLSTQNDKKQASHARIHTNQTNTAKGRKSANTGGVNSTKPMPKNAVAQVKLFRGGQMEECYAKIVSATTDDAANSAQGNQSRF